MENGNNSLKTLYLDGAKILAPVCQENMQCESISDYIIPETVSDVEKVLSSVSSLRVEDISISSTVVEVRGRLSVKALLLCDDKSLSSVTYEDDFVLRDTCSDISEESTFVLNSCTVDSLVRLVNPRKLNIKCTVYASLDIYDPVSVSPKISGAESLDDEMGIERCIESIAAITVTSAAEKDIPVSYDITLDGSYPPISEILYSSVKLLPSDIKARGNSVDVRSTVCFSALYRSEEGNVFSVNKSFNLDKTVESDDAESFDWSALLFADALSSEPAADSYGEMKLIELDFTYDIILNGVKNTSADAVKDIYSVDWEGRCEEASITSSVHKRSYASSISVNASASKDEFSAESVRSICLGRVDIGEIHSEFLDEKNKLLLSGTAVISPVCENSTVTDDDEKFLSVTFEYPFKCELEVNEHNSDTVYRTDIQPSDIRFRCDQTKIYCDFEANVRVSAYENRECKYISAFSLDKDSPVERTNAPITLCYPSGSESLWDIAKYYKVTPESITAANGFGDEGLICKKVILIPCYSGAKAASVK